MKVKNPVSQDIRILEYFLSNRSPGRTSSHRRSSAKDQWNQWTTYNLALLQLEQTTALSGRSKLYLCNQVFDITGNEVSPTKQARGDSVKEPKLHLWQNGEKKPWEKPGSVGETVLWPEEPAVCSNCSKVSVRAPLVSVVFSWWLFRC